MSAFAGGERVWVERLGNLRQVVRQELIRRQLAHHVRSGMTVLDVGCGQGTQSLALAAMGCDVIGVDPSESLLSTLADAAAGAGLRVQTVLGRLEVLDDVLGDRVFDVVCAHGLLMYVDDRRAALASLVGRVAEGGLLSLTFRNGSALAFRPAMRRDWRGALDAFDAATYRNELGVHAHADRLEDVETDLQDLGLGIAAWYGVRVFTDPDDPDDAPPATDELAALLAAEEEAGARDPYRWFGSQLHVIAVRRGVNT
jgi:S-adenosylmethionine-dependent methyltransferase